MLRVLAIVLAAAVLAGCQPPAVKAPPATENVTPAAQASSPFPSIVEFSGSTDNISAGENVTLAWYVTDADQVYIEPAVGKVPSTGFIDVSPVKSTRYTLNAVGKRGTATGWFEVKLAAYEKPRPDLIITGVTHISGLIYYKVKNIGSGAAGPSETWLYDLSHIHRDTSWVEGLKPGEEKTLPFSNYDWPGTEITICADGGYMLDEANRDNNCYQPSFGFTQAYDLLLYAPVATWRSSAGRAQFGSNGDSTTGMINKLPQATAADGNTYRNVLEVIPPASSYSWIEGVIGEYVSSWQAPGYMIPLEVPVNAGFSGLVGLSQESPPGAQALFKVGIVDERGVTAWLAEQGVSGGKPVKLTADLSAYAKKKCMLMLHTEAGLDPTGIKALWLEAKIATR